MPNVPRHDRTMALVCYGPSLTQSWRVLPTQSHDVFTVSGAYAFLRARQIIPMGHIECDPRPHKADLLQDVTDATTFYLSSSCHPSVFDAIPSGAVRLWHAWEGEEFEQALLKEDPQAFSILGGSNVGLRAIAVGSALGYRHFAIHGMDGSLEEGVRHAGRHTGKPQKVIKVRPEGSERWFETTPQLVSAAQEFVGMASRLVTDGYTFSLYGDGLVQEMLRIASNQPITLTPEETLSCPIP